MDAETEYAPRNTNAPAPGTADYLATDHLHKNLLRRTVRGSAVTLVGQALKFLFRIAAVAILARLLSPADYGLVAMANVVVEFVRVLKDAGLTVATVQKREITERQVNSLFWLNVAIGGALTVAAALTAPLAAWLFDRPEVFGITLALASTFLVGSLGGQPRALVQRQMRYVVLAVIEVASLATGVAVGVAMALSGWEYWSLIGVNIATTAAATCYAWCATSWRPGRPAWDSATRESLAFGGNLTGYWLSHYFTRNADNVLIGWYWGSGPLGLYGRAYELLMLPTRQLYAPLSSALLPALCRVADRPGAFRQAYRRTLNAMAWITLPLVALLASCPAALVQIVLGPGWDESAAVFRYLALPAALQPLTSTTGMLYIATGRTDRLLRWGLIVTPLMIAAFAVAIPWGIMAVAQAYSLVYLLVVAPGSFWFAFRHTDLRMRDATEAIRWPLATASAVLLAALLPAALFADAPAFGVLTGAAAAGFVAGAAMLGIPAVRNDFLALARELRHLGRDETAAA